MEERAAPTTVGEVATDGALLLLRYWLRGRSSFFVPLSTPRCGLCETFFFHCEHNWVKLTRDVYENTWKRGELRLYLSFPMRRRIKIEEEKNCRTPW